MHHQNNIIFFQNYFCVAAIIFYAFLQAIHIDKHATLVKFCTYLSRPLFHSIDSGFVVRNGLWAIWTSILSNISA